MKRKRFKAEVRSGHKEQHAVEVPFDPAWAWDTDPKSLWPERKGHGVKGKLNGCAFESFIVPRSGKFWMLIDESLKQKAKVSVGDTVNVSVEPLGRIHE
jgi:hypothetical protein